MMHRSFHPGVMRSGSHSVLSRKNKMTGLPLQLNEVQFGMCRSRKSLTTSTVAPLATSEHAGQLT